ncbi:MAG TPA: AmmeMemoRadiSam system protein B [Candidatus Polarisedimenticolaceae bacterium]|nr:AmmeMemoRadiSam system protein B [Candidatus Polarisedimenticolaceae bacterium]
MLGPTVAGSWYPSNPAELRRQIEGFLSAGGATEKAKGSPVALIAPHAGFVYSGAVAARAFRLLRARPIRRVVLIGPSHYAAFRGARVPRATTYRTPLGEIDLDATAIESVLDPPFVAADDEPFEREHCLEAEIPFLQCVLADGWSMVPMLIGGATTAERRSELSRALQPLIDGGTVVVVSSDFTHYGDGFHYTPFRRDVRDRIRELDMGAIDRIVAIDRTGFDSYVAETGATICGRVAIGVLLGLEFGAVDARLIDYATSGEITGDWGHCVSYAAVGFWGGA